MAEHPAKNPVTVTPDPSSIFYVFVKKTVGIQSGIPVPARFVYKKRVGFNNKYGN